MGFDNGKGDGLSRVANAWMRYVTATEQEHMALQPQDHMARGNLSFNGNAFYSYMKPIGVAWTAHNVIVIDPGPSSVTTNKHIAQLHAFVAAYLRTRVTLHKWRIFMAPATHAPWEIVNWRCCKGEDALTKMCAPRIRDTTRAQYLEAAEMNLQLARDAHDTFRSAIFPDLTIEGMERLAARLNTPPGTSLGDRILHIRALKALDS